MPAATQHVLYQHEPNKELSHFDRLYEQSLTWRTSGISALQHEGVNPFHVAIPDRGEDSPVVVYLLLDQTGTKPKESYWFEADYKSAFEAYRALARPHNSSHLRLFACVLPVKGDAKSTFEYHRPFESEHSKVLHWADDYGSWMF